MKNLTALLAMALSACGILGPTVETEEIVVSGTVTYEGTPVQAGSAELFVLGPFGRTLGSSPILTDGSYRVLGEILSYACLQFFVVVTFPVAVSDERSESRTFEGCGEHIIDFTL